MAALSLALLVTGTLRIGPGDLLAALGAPSGDDLTARVVWRLRLPRVLTAILVGYGLGMAGAAFQTVSRNPLGSPDVIGFTTGAATGAIVQIVLVDSDPLRIAALSLISGLMTALAVLLLARTSGRSEGYRLVLVGIGVGATLSGVNTVFLVMGDLDQSIAAQLWLAGSLNTRTWAHVVPAALGLLVLSPILLGLSRRLALFGMGDDGAAALGVGVERVRTIAVLAAVGMTAIATAAAGPISFVALAAPQLARRLCGTAHIPFLPAGLMGAALLLAADLTSQRMPTDLTLPIGQMTGLLGGAYLLWVLTLRSR
ncbi:iron chelate uptake ABC transporter family permease subunit [Falsirhodobacter algicola]|uniref:Iron chelate uptake ABC transporter family permease subunit n=2 Tax=Falsirhodobacter algicola TaxID=2692330 RepID=A0A8J8MUF0_9RHOB|nr:iron chelate uptake ABC transporter family permease subunit [Falsirhodobacter algicola]